MFWSFLTYIWKLPMMKGSVFLWHRFSLVEKWGHNFIKSVHLDIPSSWLETKDVFYTTKQNRHVFRKRGSQRCFTSSKKHAADSAWRITWRRASSSAPIPEKKSWHAKWPIALWTTWWNSSGAKMERWALRAWKKREILWNEFLEHGISCWRGEAFQNEKAFCKLDSGGVLFSSLPRNCSIVWFGDPSQNRHISAWWHCIIHP